MFCQKCGNQIPDGSVNCNFCGAPLQNQPAPTQPVSFEGGHQPVQPAQPAAPSPAPKKKNTTLLIIIIAILAVAVIVGAIFIANPDILDSGSSSSQSEEKDDDDDDNDKKNEDKAQSNKNNNSSNDNNNNDEHSNVDADDAEDALSEYLDVMYVHDPDEFEMWITEGESFDSLSEDDLFAAMVFAYALNDRSYSILSSDQISDNSYSFEVEFEVADFYEAAYIFEDELYDLTEDDLDAISDEEVLSFILECIAESESTYCEFDVIITYDEDIGWYVENEEEIVYDLVEDLAYAFDF